jgi:hypothetical protein
VRAIRRLRSSRGFLDHARAIEALHVPGDHRGEAATLRARDSRATVLRLKVLAYEGSFPPPEIRSYASGGKGYFALAMG